MTTAHADQWQRFGSLLIWGATAPGHEISSAIHFAQPYRFRKLCPTASAGCTTPRGPRTPRHGYPACRLGPGGHSRLTATRWARGRAIPPTRAAATGARQDTRAAPGPVGSGDGVRAQGWVNSIDPRLPEAPPGKARASGGPRRWRPRSRPFSRFYDRREPAQGQRGGAPGPAGL